MDDGCAVIKSDTDVGFAEDDHFRFVQIAGKAEDHLWAAWSSCSM